MSNQYIQGLAEKFIGSPRYSLGMWANRIYTRVNWKVHRLTKNLSLNVMKYSLCKGRLKILQAKDSWNVKKYGLYKGRSKS